MGPAALKRRTLRVAYIDLPGDGGGDEGGAEFLEELGHLYDQVKRHRNSRSISKVLQ